MDKRHDIGKRIRTIRQQLKLSQEKMAKELGVTNKAISAYENGDSYPSLSCLIKIAQLGDVSFDWLITGGDVAPKELSRDEARLITAFRQSSREDQQMIFRIIQNAAAAAINEKNMT